MLQTDLVIGHQQPAQWGSDQHCRPHASPSDAVKGFLQTCGDSDVPSCPPQNLAERWDGQGEGGWEDGMGGGDEQREARG